MSKMADLIARLPTDETAPTNSEIQVIEYLFNEDGSQKTARTMVSEFSEAMFVALLFIIFSSTWCDIIIMKYIPQASNTVIRVLIKSVCIMVLFYIYSNSSLVTRKDLATR